MLQTSVGVGHRRLAALVVVVLMATTIVVRSGRGVPTVENASDQPPAAQVAAVLAPVEPEFGSAANRLFRRLYAAGGNASSYNETANATLVPVWTTIAPVNATNDTTTTAAATTTTAPTETPMIDESTAPPDWWWPNTTLPPGNWSNVTFAPNVTLVPNVTVAPNVTNTTAPNTTFAPNVTFAPITTTAPSTNETAVIDMVCRRSGNTWSFSSPLLDPSDDATVTGYVIDITTHNTVDAIQHVVDRVCHDLVWVPLTPMPTNTSNATNNVTQPPGNHTNGTGTVDWILWCREGVVNFTNGTFSVPQWNATANGTWNESRWQQAGTSPIPPSSFVPGTTIRWEDLPWWPRYLAWNSSFPAPITLGVNASRWSGETELERLVHFVCGGGPATKNPGTIAPTLPPETTPQPATTVPDRSGVLPWFLLPNVLARTPIFTVGTFVSDNGLVDALAFSRDLSRILRGSGLWQFADADAAAVVQMTHCAVERASEYGTAPLNPAMCRLPSRCNGDRVPCLPGIQRCTCPSVSWYLPLNDTYVAPNTESFAMRQTSAASDATQVVANASAAGDRRQTDPTFVQLQFPLRLDMAESFLPATPQDIIDVLDAALNQTQEALLNDDALRDAYRLNRDFIFIRFAFDNLYGDTGRVPDANSEPQLLWLLVLLVFPVAAMGYGIFRLVQYIRWRRYGSQLRVHMDAYDEDLGDEDPDAAAAAKGAMMAVAAGMGDGDWADGNAGRADPDEFFAVADATALEEFDLLETASGAAGGGADDDNDDDGPTEV